MCRYVIYAVFKGVFNPKASNSGASWECWIGESPWESFGAGQQRWAAEQLITWSALPRLDIRAMPCVVDDDGEE